LSHWVIERLVRCGVKRREFVSAVGLGGYSLVVLAGEPAGGQMRPEFGRIAPAEVARRRAGPEPNLRLVEQ